MMGVFYKVGIKDGRYEDEFLFERRSDAEEFFKLVLKDYESVHGEIIKKLKYNRDWRVEREEFKVTLIRIPTYDLYSARMRYEFRKGILK